MSLTALFLHWKKIILKSLSIKNKQN